MRYAVGVVIISFGMLPVASGQTGQNPKAKYDALLARVESGDPAADIGALRLAYAATPDYVSEPDIDLYKEMSSALSKKDFATAIKAAQKALKTYYVDIDAHQVLYRAYRETNEAEKASFHQKIVRALIQSILDSGDGKSEATAFQVISTREEYIVLSVKGLRPQKQSLSGGQNHHQFDVMEAVDEQGSKHTLYFNIDLPMAELDRALSK